MDLNRKVKTLCSLLVMIATPATVTASFQDFEMNNEQKPSGRLGQAGVSCPPDVTSLSLPHSICCTSVLFSLTSSLSHSTVCLTKLCQAFTLELGLKTVCSAGISS